MLKILKKKNLNNLKLLNNYFGSHFTWSVTSIFIFYFLYLLRHNKNILLLICFLGNILPNKKKTLLYQHVYYVSFIIFSYKNKLDKKTVCMTYKARSLLYYQFTTKFFKKQNLIKNKFYKDPGTSVPKNVDSKQQVNLYNIFIAFSL